MHHLGLLLSFWQEGCLPDESTQRQQRWAHWKGKSSCRDRRQNSPSWEQMIPVWSQHLLPFLSDHCVDRHKHFTGIWVMDLKQCNRETLILTLCTKCKVMQFPSNEKQQQPQAKALIRDGKTQGIVRFLQWPHGGATLADLRRQHFVALLFTGTWTLERFWWLFYSYFNI